MENKLKELIEMEYQEQIQKSERLEKLKKLVSNITDHVNSFNRDGNSFNEIMSREHRTLQQSFTRLCFQWIEHVASEDYKTDGRNEWSKKISIELIEQFQKLDNHQGTKPSNWLGCI